jgi:methyl-accepting chemotaxis protein
MKIRSKLILSFMIAVVFAVVLAVFGIYTSSTIDTGYSYILEHPQKRMNAMAQASIHAARMRRHMVTMAFEAQNQNTAAFEESKKNADLEVVELENAITEFIANMQSDTTRKEEDKVSGIEAANGLMSLAIQYQNQVINRAYEAALAGDYAQIVTIIDEGAGIANSLLTTCDAQYQSASNFVDQTSSDLTVTSGESMIALVVISIIAVALLLAIAFIIASIISKPLKNLVVIANDVAKGQLNVNSIPETRDEIGALAKNFFTVIDVVKGLVGGLKDMGENHKNGDIDYYLDPAKFQGSYREVAEETNAMVKEYVTITIKYMETISGLIGGDFKIELEKLPGKKALMNEKLEEARAAITELSGEIANIIKNVSNGNTTARIDAGKYKGDWVEIMDGLNQVLQSYGDPINESLSVLQQISEGNFSNNMKGSYKGDFNTIKTAVNTMVANTSSYLTEISSVLTAIANNNLNLSIKRNYVGDFSSIKDAINLIVEKLNGVIGEIISATEQVAAGSKQISESSMTLAQGASEQASAVQELTATIDTINAKTRLNADNADKANQISTTSRNNAATGNEEMQKMLASMSSIKEASANISKIIKSIEDIAFQTNLLALNAAVEAARAGEHGKGFAVVAEEVRSLAGRSQEAAKETTTLIDDTISKVNDGTSIATLTAASLTKIVSDVNGVSDLIKEIAHSSTEQAEAVSQVSEGLMQISEVVQKNSATSEESASASQQLASQSSMLENMVSVFVLKKP